MSLPLNTPALHANTQPHPGAARVGIGGPVGSG
ncbi:hypothetical protein ALQ30_200438 [Pseudomonas syringae pv. persicae]|nr:hypothetical protein ALQ30_200438 [Pseudomonas syringae pv. persicae]